MRLRTQLTWAQWQESQSVPESRRATWLRDQLGLPGVPNNCTWELFQSAGDPEQTPYVIYDPPPVIYTSPDSGGTVYANGEFHSETPEARQRRRLGYMQQAIKLAAEDPEVLEYFTAQIHAVLVFARLKGHEVTDWSETP